MNYKEQKKSNQIKSKTHKTLKKRKKKERKERMNLITIEILSASNITSKY